jgi:N-methylhydantoinase A
MRVSGKSAGEDKMKNLRIGIDIGGTFTDLFCVDQRTGELKTAKTWSRPEDPGAILEMLAEIDCDPGDIDVFSHAATVGINAVVTRSGAVTGLLCTRGHRDILDMGTGLRDIDQLWDLTSRRPHQANPLIPRKWRRAVTERTLFDGSILIPLDDEEVICEVEALYAEGVRSIAVAYLNSYLNPVHEQRTVAIIRERFPDVAAFASTEIFPSFRELARTTTVAVNAYVSPRVDAYLARMSNGLRAKGFDGLFTVMKVDGGFATTEGARGRGIETMYSGPVAGVRAACFLGEITGDRNLMLIDIGGTTADVSIVTDLVPPVTREYEIEQDLFLGLPAVEVTSIGAGGGSIAWIDSGGALRVGPQSAGANPGPACYGRGGTQPTVADAHLIRGTLLGDRFLGGGKTLDLEAARRAVAKVAEPLGLSIEEAADGIITILEVNMAAALRNISVFKGRHPADYTLVAIGGNGPSHGAALGRELGVSEVLIPRWPGEFSAFGLLASDYRTEVGRSLVRPLGEIGAAEMNTIFEELEAEARAFLSGQGVREEDLSFVRWMDGMYMGQTWDTACELPSRAYEDADMAQCADWFGAAYETNWGIRLNMPVRVSTLRVAAVGRRERPAMNRIAQGGAEPPAEALLETRPLTLRAAGGLHTYQAPVYDRDRLLAGNVVQGPALIIQRTATTTLLQEDEARIDEFGNIRVRKATSC